MNESQGEWMDGWMDAGVNRESIFVSPSLVKRSEQEHQLLQDECKSINL